MITTNEISRMSLERTPLRNKKPKNARNPIKPITAFDIEKSRDWLCGL